MFITDPRGYSEVTTVLIFFTLHMKTVNALSFLNPDNSEHFFYDISRQLIHYLFEIQIIRNVASEIPLEGGNLHLNTVVEEVALISRNPQEKNLLCMRSDDILSALNLDIEQKGGLLMQPKIEEMSLIRLFTQMEVFSVATDNFLIMMYLLDKA